MASDGQRNSQKKQVMQSSRKVTRRLCSAGHAAHTLIEGVNIIKADTAFRKTGKSAALPFMPGCGAHAFAGQLFRHGAVFLTLAVHVGAR